MSRGAQQHRRTAGGRTRARKGTQRVLKHGKGVRKKRVLQKGTPKGYSKASTQKGVFKKGFQKTDTQKGYSKRVLKKGTQIRAPKKGTQIGCSRRGAKKEVLKKGYSKRGTEEGALKKEGTQKAVLKKGTQKGAHSEQWPTMWYGSMYRVLTAYSHHGSSNRRLRLAAAVHRW